MKKKIRNEFIGFRIDLNALLSFGLCLFFMVALTFVFYGVSVHSVSKSNGIVIVIDPGHGARDGGSVGKLGTIEKDINLKYSLALKTKLIDMGYIVHMTRKTDEPLYLKDANNKKQSDMKARMNVIKRANPNLVISIHMNSFSDSSVHGANTFYRKGDESGKQISDLIQSSLKKFCSAKNTKGKVGDYYILNESYYTSVLIECGFLSNIEEERLLNSDEYLDKFTSAVCNAVFLYFGQVKIV